MSSLPDESKICPRCKQSKPISDFYIRSKKNCPRPCSHCKACMQETQAERYKADPDSFHRRSVSWQKRNPEKVKAICDRSRNKNRLVSNQRARECYEKNRRDKKAAYRKANAEAIRLRNSEYRQSHQEDIKAATAKYYAERKEVLKEKQRLWRLANPDRYLEIHRKWKQSNVDACRATAQKRYAKKRGNGGSFTAEEWAAIKVDQDFTCLMCNRREPEIRLCIDHIVPISEGGPNIASNLQGLCRSCNSKKWRRTIDLRRKPLTV